MLFNIKSKEGLALFQKQLPSREFKEIHSMLLNKTFTNPTFLLTNLDLPIATTNLEKITIMVRREEKIEKIIRRVIIFFVILCLVSFIIIITTKIVEIIKTYRSM